MALGGAGKQREPRSGTAGSANRDDAFLASTSNKRGGFPLSSRIWILPRNNRIGRWPQENPYPFWPGPNSTITRRRAQLEREAFGDDNYMRSLAGISVESCSCRGGCAAAAAAGPGTHTDPLSISLISGLILRGVRTSRGHPETGRALAPGAGKTLFRLVESSSVTSTLINPAASQSSPSSHSGTTGAAMPILPIPSRPHPPSPQHDKASPVK